MINRIKNISVFQARLEPVEADIYFSVYPDSLYSTTHVRGRLVGPRCVYASTVEVAYPLREQSREYESTGTPRIILRALIPEPCFWDPQSPFLYRLHLELWQKDDLCQQRSLDIALHTFRFSSKGLTWNHRPLDLRGLAGPHFSEAHARTFHQEGFNVILVPQANDKVWEMGDRFGLLILGRISAPKDRNWENSRNHVSALGWVADQELLHHPLIEAVGPSSLSLGEKPFGLELKYSPPANIPEGFSFFLCRKNLLADLAGNPLPKIILLPPDQADFPLSQGIIGWLREMNEE